MEMEQQTKVEAAAFDQRIEERVNAGFVPDLRQAVKCSYFYKSFWRDPHFVKLYLGEMVDTMLAMLQAHAGANLRILDAGCGAGYVSLEFARAGHHVVGIDISERCIEVAKEYLELNPFRDQFGSLQYYVMPFDQATGVYDCILFSGFLHHLPVVEEAICKGIELLSPGGLILCCEPCHDEWRKEDAAQVALIRGLLSLTGYWYESSLGTHLHKSEENLETYIEEVYVEYVTERDKHEVGGQSPNDNLSSGQEILAVLRNHLEEVEYRLGVSFIYRLLGGLRGSDAVVYKIADFLAMYDKYSVGKGLLKPNGFYFLGKKPKARLAANDSCA